MRPQAQRDEQTLAIGTWVMAALMGAPVLVAIVAGFTAFGAALGLGGGPGLVLGGLPVLTVYELRRRKTRPKSTLLDQ